MLEAEPLEADTIYFGGGTPSLLSPDQLTKVLAAVRSSFDIAPNAEVTMEMNPATVTPETLAGFRELGINRASFGVQTFNELDLKLLARGHDASDARNTFRMLRDAGFDNVSFDLIAGLPGQTMEDWQQNLSEAVAMSPEHLSLYLLEMHSSTPLAEQLRSGRRPLPDPELAAEMYEVMVDTLAAAGYEQYEISNFSRPGFESRHNTKYWTLDPVYGFGVSAHSFDGRRRYANERDTAKYVSLVDAGTTPVVEVNELSPEQLSGEFAFLNLRLNKGIDLDDFKRRFGFDLVQRFRADLASVADAGLIDLDEKSLKLTRKGMVYSNEVFSIFV